MPELPEVETTVRYLRSCLVGKRIKAVKILSKKQFPNRPSLIIGAKIAGIARRGKILIFTLDNGRSVLTHLKLTGQLVFASHFEHDKAEYPRPIPFAGGNTLPGRATRVIIVFTDGSALFFNDLRKFGWMRIIKGKNEAEELKELGLEPLSAAFTPRALADIFKKTRRAVKIAMMDQKKIAGIGNIYANEALFRARIAPQRPANSLTEKEIGRLYKAIVFVLKEGIRYQGTSAADDAYVQPNGNAGRFQSQLKVYQREGERCFNCGGTIKRINLGGRGSFFCPHCQR